jgi:hypothetical protein
MPHEKQPLLPETELTDWLYNLRAMLSERYEVIFCMYTNSLFYALVAFMEKVGVNKKLSTHKKGGLP